MSSPGGSVVLTVRLVRSFEHRNFRPVVLHGVSPDQSVEDFMGTVRDHVSSRADLPLPFRKYNYDTMKIVHQAHGAKTSELVMSLDDDEKLVLRAGQTLREAGIGLLKQIIKEDVSRNDDQPMRRRWLSSKRRLRSI